MEKIKELQISGKKIGFTASSFDLLHAGHYIMLEDSRKQCDYLVVGLQSDPTLDLKYIMKTGGKQKNKPIQTLKERHEQLKGCKYIDFIIKYNNEDELYNLIKDLKPDVRILGSDWKNKNYTGYDLDIKIYWHNRNHDYSTSNLRKRVFDAEVAKRDKTWSDWAKGIIPYDTPNIKWKG